MEALHGVMMHGDEQGGKNHGKDHDEMLKLKDEGNLDKPGVKVNDIFYLRIRKIHISKFADTKIIHQIRLGNKSHIPRDKCVNASLRNIKIFIYLFIKSSRILYFSFYL